jgi:hypothetical protein
VWFRNAADFRTASTFNLSNGLCALWGARARAAGTFPSRSCPVDADLCRIEVSPRMPLFRRCTAWLCLALVFLIGLNPTQGFVLCIEADGCVSVETRVVDADCVGCDDHGAEAASDPTVASAIEAPPCPCFDVDIPASPDEDLVRAQAWSSVVPWFAPRPEVASIPTIACERASPAGCADAPRVSDSWVRLQSVVLRV